MSAALTFTMAPSTTKANYKTYEAQARMVRAIVAAHPDVKWNYKEIASCYGSDMTEHALNHRFRRLRAQATLIREARQRGLDMKDLVGVDELPTTQDAIDTDIFVWMGRPLTPILLVVHISFSLRPRAPPLSTMKAEEES
ncbi:hypothetical protein CDD83_5860 [Cordyceps sp. RAO-2017]|nr:hypothetical protein CDD83_5860 [Cordyceps sp. RAO-2017]